MINKNIQKIKWKFELGLFILMEIILMFLVFPFFSFPVTGDVGGNATIRTYLTVGNTYPEILNVSINDDAASVTLVANDTVTVFCTALLRDYNNDTDFDTLIGEFFDNSNSTFGNSTDNNFHYANDSCDINTSFGSWKGYSDDNFSALGNCTFEVEYYANFGEWNCTLVINDTGGWNATGSDNITVNELLAVGLPPDINYGTVNATFVSDENETDVINYGNVPIDIALSGYAMTPGDGWAMNCTFGNVQNISVEYEKYNITTSIPGSLTLAEFEANYTNLTSSPVTEQYDLLPRVNDTENYAKNQTYWRIYVPIGVAGTCSGNIVFGAMRSQ